MYQIQQSTTTWPLVFLLVQSSDHITGLTGASPTVTLSKNGGAFASPSGAVTEIANGWYKVAGNATDSGTLGPLILHATATSGDPTDTVYEVVAFNPQDAVHLGLSCLPNTAVTTNASLITSGTGTDQLLVESGVVDANAVQWLDTAISAPATAGIPDVNVKNINNVIAATPGASGGILIAGTNAATTINALTLTGAAAVTSTPATAGLTITGGAASTTGGGTSAAAVVATGGAGAASTNGAAAGATFTAGGTTTVSGSDGVKMVGTGNGNGLTLTHAGGGLDFNALTSPPLNVNAIQINSLSTSPITTIAANLGTTQPINFQGTGAGALAKCDVRDILGAAVNTSLAQIGVNVVNIVGTTPTVDANNNLEVDVVDIAGVAVATGTAQLGVNVVNIAGQAAAIDSNNLLKVDVEDVNGSATIETGITFKQSLQYMSAALVGVLSGAATTSVAIQAINNSGTTRISATVDANGNRSAITLS